MTSLPLLPKLTLELVADTLSLFHTDTAVDVVVVYDTVTRSVVGASNASVTPHLAAQMVSYSASTVDNGLVPDLGKVGCAKVDFANSTLVIVPGDDFGISALVRKHPEPA